MAKKQCNNCNSECFVRKLICDNCGFKFEKKAKMKLKNDDLLLNEIIDSDSESLKINDSYNKNNLDNRIIEDKVVNNKSNKKNQQLDIISFLKSKHKSEIRNEEITSNKINKDEKDHNILKEKINYDENYFNYNNEVKEELSNKKNKKMLKNQSEMVNNTKSIKVKEEEEIVLINISNKSKFDIQENQWNEFKIFNITSICELFKFEKCVSNNILLEFTLNANLNNFCFIESFSNFNYKEKLKFHFSVDLLIDCFKISNPLKGFILRPNKINPISQINMCSHQNKFTNFFSIFWIIDDKLYHYKENENKKQIEQLTDGKINSKIKCYSFNKESRLNSNSKIMIINDLNLHYLIMFIDKNLKFLLPSLNIKCDDRNDYYNEYLLEIFDLTMNEFIIDIDCFISKNNSKYNEKIQKEKEFFKHIENNNCESLFESNEKSTSKHKNILKNNIKILKEVNLYDDPKYFTNSIYSEFLIALESNTINLYKYDIKCIYANLDSFLYNSLNVKSNYKITKSKFLEIDNKNDYFIALTSDSVFHLYSKFMKNVIQKIKSLELIISNFYFKYDFFMYLTQHPSKISISKLSLKEPDCKRISLSFTITDSIYNEDNHKYYFIDSESNFYFLDKDSIDNVVKNRKNKVDENNLVKITPKSCIKENLKSKESKMIIEENNDSSLNSACSSFSCLNVLTHLDSYINILVKNEIKINYKNYFHFFPIILMYGLLEINNSITDLDIREQSIINDLSDIITKDILNEENINTEKTVFISNNLQEIKVVKY